VRRTTVLRNIGSQAHIDRNAVGSGVMYLSNADRARVWEKWIADPVGHMKECGAVGDQLMIESVLHGSARWQDLLPGSLLSYKLEIAPRATVPADCAIVYFHGRPRPWKVAADWMPRPAQAQWDDLDAGLIDSTWVSARENAKLSETITSLRGEIYALREQQDALRLDNETLRVENKALFVQREAMSLAKEAVGKENEALRASTSWRVTYPLRFVAHNGRRLLFFQNRGLSRQAER
jgi:hypothetical protein